MKPILITCFCLLLFASNLYSQFACSNGLKIQSPVVSKPSEGSIASASCTSMVVQWNGTPDQTYEVMASFREPGKVKSLPIVTVANIFCDNNNHCKATIPVTEGTRVSWSVQAVNMVNERVFFSYPLQGEQDFLVPACGQPFVKLPTQSTEGGNVEKDKYIISNDKLAMYPNPVANELNLKLISSYKGNVSVLIVDVSGRSMMQMNMHKEQKEYSGHITVRSLKPGHYFVHINMQDGRTYITKFLKD